MMNKNIFETTIGALNIAPIKISGQYKIVVDLNLNLWLDDYTGLRTKIDKDKPFLNQVSNFLKLKNEIIDNNILNYGGHQKYKNKSYHIPLFLNTKEYPKFFVLNKISNSTITNNNDLYNSASILKLIDLEKIGLFKIFDEIMDEKYFEYPLYFNFNENNIDIFGYSINKNIPVKKTIDILNLMSNQAYLENLNNKILNTYLIENIFYPKFLNIEFEFEFTNNYKYFENFYGFLSDETTVNSINQNEIFAKIKDFGDTIEFSQIFENINYELFDYKKLIGTASIQELNEQPPKYSFKTNMVSVNDSIKILFLGNVEFEYIVTPEDIVTNSLYETFTNICKHASKKSNYDFQFKVEGLNSAVIVSILSNIANIFEEDYYVEVPNYFQVYDRLEGSSNYKYFRNISLNDVWLTGNLTLLDNVTTITIGDNDYTITDKFKNSGRLILRLNNAPNINKLSYCKIYENKTEYIIKLIPIDFLTYNVNLGSEKLYEFNNYCNELHSKFDSNGIEIEQTINDFKTFCIDGKYQYMNDNNASLTDSNTVLIDNFNTEIIKNILFYSGITSYLTPNILNIDKHFLQNNGNIDLNNGNDDELRYSWFLIKGVTPNYLINDVRALRYFETEPKLTSKLVIKNSEYCETIFLGVKYQLPIEYVNYSFAIYLDFNDMQYNDLKYKANIDNINKTIYLSINKYLDFVDLLRGGDENAEPLMDLSFFTNVFKSYNINSTYNYSFKSGGVKLCDTSANIFFNLGIVNDWKVQDSFGDWHIALTRENAVFGGITNDFTLLFPQTGDAIFYVYSKITINTVEYEYLSLEITLKAISECKQNYIWCKDIEFKFFDTNDLFLKKYNQQLNVEEIFHLEPATIISSTDSSNNIFGDFKQITTIQIGQNQELFELMLPSKILKFKEYYFEINYNITEDASGNKTLTKTVFKFPEFFMLNATDNDIINQFDYYPDNDLTIYNQKITIFDRNQIWYLIKNLFLIDLKFKFQTKEQIRNLMNLFTPTNFKEYSDKNLIETNISNKFLDLNIIDNDRNIVIHKILNQNKINLITRYKSSYLPLLDKCDEFNFQLDKYKKYSSYFNIYDKNFGGIGISATGLINEVIGNIVSSLFCYEKSIEIELNYTKIINIKNTLNNYFSSSNLIFDNNNNQNYISKFNLNIDEYIVNNFVEFLLNYYKLDCVLNEFNNKISFHQINNEININSETKKLKLIFVRK